jgi:hypothetical protein
LCDNQTYEHFWWTSEEISTAPSEAMAPYLKNTVPEDTYIFQAYYPCLISGFNIVLGLKTFYQAAILKEMTPKASLILCY